MNVVLLENNEVINLIEVESVELAKSLFPENIAMEAGEAGMGWVLENGVLVNPKAIPTVPVLPLTITLSGVAIQEPGRYNMPLGGKVLYSATMPTPDDTYFMPLERDGAEIVPIPVQFKDGKASGEFTPDARGFYRVTQAGINKDLKGAMVAFDGLTLVVY